MRTFLIIFWGVDAFGALVRVEYFDSAQTQNAWVKVLVTDEGARVRAVCVYGVQDEAKAGSQSTGFASAVEDAQAWLPQCPESVEIEGVTLVPVSTSVFSYDGNDSRLLHASTDGRVLAAGGAPAGVPEFGVPSIGAGAAAGSAAGFDASVMHPLVWDENSFVPRVLGVAGSSMPSVGSLVPGAGLLDPYGWASLGVAAPAVPSAQGASATGGVPVLPDSLVGVSAASGLVLGSSGFEVLGARVVDSRVARFTAPDPLSAPVGAGWGADRFSLVGGNPVLLVDPWGLSPVSVEDFDKYREQKGSSGITGWVRRTANSAVALWDKGKKWYQAATETAKGLWNKAAEGVKVAWNKTTTFAKNAWDKTKKWVSDNKEYIIGGLMAAAGVAVGFASVAGGPATMMLLGGISGSLTSAGISMITQKKKGSVDYGQVAKEALIGGLTGAIGGGIAGNVVKSAKASAGVVTKLNPLGKAGAWFDDVAKPALKPVDTLIRKAVDYKPLASLKGASSGIYDDVAKMAPARELKDFLVGKASRHMVAGEHKILSTPWIRNQAASTILKFSVKQPIGWIIAPPAIVNRTINKLQGNS